MYVFFVNSWNNKMTHLKYRQFKIYMLKGVWKLLVLSLNESIKLCGVTSRWPPIIFMLWCDGHRYCTSVAVNILPWGRGVHLWLRQRHPYLVRKKSAAGSWCHWCPQDRNGFSKSFEEFQIFTKLPFQISKWRTYRQRASEGVDLPSVESMEFHIWWHSSAWVLPTDKKMRSLEAYARPGCHMSFSSQVCKCYFYRSAITIF